MQKWQETHNVSKQDFNMSTALAALTQDMFSHILIKDEFQYNLI